MPKQPKDTAADRRGAQVLRLGLQERRKMAEDLDYIPMPDSVVKQIEAVWKKDVKDDSGKPIF